MAAKIKAVKPVETLLPDIFIRETFPQVNTTATQILLRDPSRIAVIFSPPGTNNHRINISANVTVGARGWLITPTSANLMITSRDFPGLTQFEFWAVSSVVSFQHITEVLYRPKG